MRRAARLRKYLDEISPSSFRKVAFFVVCAPLKACSGKNRLRKCIPGGVLRYHPRDTVTVRAGERRF